MEKILKLLAAKESERANVFLSFLLRLVFIGPLIGQTYLYTNKNAALSHSYVLHFPWELHIPFMPSWILVYLSMYLMIIIPVFFLNKMEMKAYSYGIAISTIVGALIFYYYPTHAAFQRPDQVELFQPLFSWLYSVDGPYNLVPSMHITYSLLATLFMTKYVKSYWVWHVAICFSVLFTHQHHLIDILAGTVLAVISYKLGRKIEEKEDFRF